ncbi:MAG TPA: glycosyltransferase N-terminal domain-containing protein, partial [Puia sp.]|nr:glycosyltransferase N-terminal domain-containing protein [Puia sp.]
KAKLWLEGRRGLFEQMRAELEPKKGDYPVVWMHCASLGEFEQGRPVIEGLRQMLPECRIVLSFFSPSGYTTKKGYAGADHIFYLPLDSPRNARTFIDLVQPDLVLWVKYDYWYYFLVELKKRKIPVLLVSGIFRPDQPFFRWYGRLHRYMLECFTHLFVQTEASRLLLERLRLTSQVTVSGDTRFDRVIGIAEAGEALPMVVAFCGNAPVIVAGSTWVEDEEELDHFANSHPELRFIVAPHEIGEDRMREIERLFRHAVRYSVLEKGGGGSLAGGRSGSAGGRNGSAGGRSGSAGGALAGGAWPEPNVLIIDNIGMLSRLYRYATIAYVGGGFGDDGVHNVLEAAVYGKPVVFGPVIEKYIEAVELVEGGGGLIIDSALEAEKVFTRLLKNPEECREAGAAASNYVYSKRGATEKIVGYIGSENLLERNRTKG